MILRFPALFILLASLWTSSPAAAADEVSPDSGSPQQSAGAPADSAAQAVPDKRVLGVLPNYRSAFDTGVYKPITVKQKFAIGAKDSFDYPTLLLAGAIAGLGQLNNTHPSLGQGFAGYGRRLGTSYGDQAIGNMMTEAIFPSLLREDPRYFIRGRGGVWSRLFYAASRVVVTRTDAGGRRFNFSELLGNGTMVAISNAYYTDGRTVGDNFARLGQQIGVDALSQILKELWPDFKRHLTHHRADSKAAPGH